MSVSHRGRFAPSPTGRLHLGNARSALLGWLWARSSGGEFLLRIEDLDPERSKPEFIDGIYEDLTWLGLDWDGPVWRQSERKAVYDEALATLEAQGRAYRCWCSRAATAPHGDEGPVYPGTCRHAPQPKADRPPAWRFAVEPGVVRFNDAVHGASSQDVAYTVGDFVVRRADGVASYQLAVVVDDALSGVNHVLRGDDLLGSTHRQLQLQQALGYRAPVYAHVPLLVQPDGRRMAKRDGASTVAGLRAKGWSPERVIGLLAQTARLGTGEPEAAAHLVARFSLAALARDAVVLDEASLE